MILEGVGVGKFTPATTAPIPCLGGDAPVSLTFQRAELNWSKLIIGPTGAYGSRVDMREGCTRRQQWGIFPLAWRIVERQLMALNARTSPRLSFRCAFSFRHIVGSRHTVINSAKQNCHHSCDTSASRHFFRTEAARAASALLPMPDTQIVLGSEGEAFRVAGSWDKLSSW